MQIPSIMCLDPTNSRGSTTNEPGRARRIRLVALLSNYFSFLFIFFFWLLPRQSSDCGDWLRMLVAIASHDQIGSRQVVHTLSE